MRSATLACSLLLIIQSAADVDNSQFLFENAAICGEPFADPLWIPVLDMCKIECDGFTHYCVENDELEQMCKPMPEECRLKFEREESSKWRKTEGISGNNIQRQKLHRRT